MSRMARWVDHKGGIVEAPWAEIGRATAYRWDDQLTHWVMGEQTETPQRQAITLCGKRALELPGRGEVTCAECIVAAPAVEPVDTEADDEWQP